MIIDQDRCDNMDKLIINTTMETKEPGSSEAFKSETNTKLMKNNLKSEGSQVAHTYATLQDPSPLRFHKVHGKYIKMSGDYCTAQIKILHTEFSSMPHERTVFSSRPITVGEKVCLCLELMNLNHAAFFKFGFTNCDPSTITSFKFVDCYKLLQLKNEIDNYIILQFCVKPSGKVWCNINDTDMGYIFKEIDINVPLWACIAELHLVFSLKFIDCLNETDELKPTSLDNPPATTYASIELVKTNQKQDMKGDETKLKPDLDKKTEENEESASTARGRGSGVTPVNVTLQDLPPVHFHKVHGAYIKMSGDYCTARLERPDLSKINIKDTLENSNKFLVFSSRPIAYGEKVHLRLKVGPNIILFNTLLFGLTNCDPNNISDLKSWEYNNWECYILNRAHCQTTVLYFCVKQSGELTSYLNVESKLAYSFKKVNTSRPLWAVFSLPHNLTSVEFINSLKETKSEEHKLISEEKHSSPTTNALVELNNQIDNVSNHKIDSILAIEKPKSYEAFTSITNTDKIESPLKAEGNTPAEVVQPTSSTDVKYIQKPVDYDVIHFAKIVEYHLNRLPEDKRLKCMQKILEVLDESSK